MLRFYSLLFILLLARLFSSNLSWHSQNWVPASALREQITNDYKSVLPYSEANLLSGVVLGNLTLDSKLRGRLADAGVSHVVAASGMNITLFSGFLVWLATFFGWRTIYKAAFVVVFVIFYSSITGFAPPIVRAGIMVGASYLASLSGRQNGSWLGLIWSAYIMLWVTPSLITSASFLLSFSAMTGQIFLSSFLPNSPREVNFLTLFWHATAQNFWQSFLALIFTLPVVLWFFAKFSLVSLLSNLLILWTVEPLMILGGLLGIVGIFSLDLAKVIALPTEPLLRYFLWVVGALSGKDYFLVHWQVVSWTFPVGYYLLLAGFIYWWQSPTRQPRG